MPVAKLLGRHAIMISVYYISHKNAIKSALRHQQREKSSSNFIFSKPTSKLSLGI